MGFVSTGSKREPEDRIIPRSVDADDSDVEVKSDDERLIILHIFLTLCSHCYCHRECYVLVL